MVKSCSILSLLLLVTVAEGHVAEGGFGQGVDGSLIARLLGADDDGAHGRMWPARSRLVAR